MREESCFELTEPQNRCSPCISDTMYHRSHKKIHQPVDKLQTNAKPLQRRKGYIKYGQAFSGGSKSGWEIHGLQCRIYPEYGSGRFFRNVGNHPQDFMHPGCLREAS
ncbi:hypothetical protein L798_15177 [Zootermopsis nevadensis]|uniref:Uncharacterized protein n=1 Tax=Zootermopsis nevadensis TaxID=136037 RepID=A0A067RGY1_ZOONE|nr:hypothetical protein L798_15177 [Zootermopsis nevadensis]